MARVVTPLTDMRARSAKPKQKAYKLADGGGLYLEVTPAGSKLWRMKFLQESGKESRLSFGAYPEVSLTQARTARAAARQLKATDVDPGKAKRDAWQAKAAAAAHTFETVARRWLEKTVGDRAAITQKKNTAWFANDVFPEIGSMPISTIRPRHLLVALQKIQARGAIESAHKVKQLCGQVFRYAVAAELAERDITSGLADALASAPNSHYPAITDPARVGPLLRAIDGYEGFYSVVAGLRLSPLVFVRPGELRSAEKSEFDLDAGEWRIPGAKMKMGIDHIVPLSTQAVKILRWVLPLSGHSRFVFRGVRSGERCISDAAVNAALRAMGYGQDVMTGHGFRAMARTILDEVLGERVDLIEHQLAHAVKDVNGRAYNRTAHLPARREMMQRWADYLDQLRAGTVVK
ncbi:MAG: integrase arm-type DNA-binding domain-containing protein [Massilia sp.]|nr:integrase arm-type DNA-binding domain-containing protein [Massilia sp.]